MGKYFFAAVLALLPSIVNAGGCYSDGECNSGEFCVFAWDDYDGGPTQRGYCCNESDLDCIITNSEGAFYSALAVDATSDVNQWCYSGNCGYENSCLKTYQVQKFGTVDIDNEAFPLCTNLYTSDDRYSSEPLEECIVATRTSGDITTITYCFESQAVDQGDICWYVDAAQHGEQESEDDWRTVVGSNGVRFYQRYGTRQIAQYGYSCELTDIGTNYTCSDNYWDDGTSCQKCPSLTGATGGEIFGTTNIGYNNSITNCMQKRDVKFMDDSGTYTFDGHDCYYKTGNN